MYREVASITHNELESDRTFETAVLPERGRLYRLALVITRDPSSAEDAVQETLLSAWRSWSKVRDPSHPGPWLTRICVNQCLRRRPRFDRAMHLDDTSLVSVSARDHMELGAELLDFDRAFRLLSPRQRAVFTLHVRYGYTVVECAHFVRCRPGTARSHLARAVTTLRREMDHA